MPSLAKVSASAACVALLCLSGFAEDPKLHAASGDPKNLTQIFAQFDTPVPKLKDCDVEFPSSCNAKSAPWIVMVYLPSGIVFRDRVTDAKVTRPFSTRGNVTLTLEHPTTGFIRVDVSYIKVHTSASFDAKADPKTKSVIAACEKKDDCDVYISGAVSSAVGASPNYLIDSKATYQLLSFHNGGSTLSLTGDVSTANQPTADPDSFHWAIPYQRVDQFAIENWSVIGMEFDKTGNAINLVSAPGVTHNLISHRFLRKSAGQVSDATIRASIGFDISGGLEFGDNLRNQFAVTNKSGRGEGFFLRGVPSASVYLVILKTLGLDKLSLSSSYTARIPTTDELFLETLHQKTPVPILTSKTRHYLEDNLQFMITKYFGINIQHKYGSLPPAFSFVDHTVSVGLVLGFKQK